MPDYVSSEGKMPDLELSEEEIRVYAILYFAKIGARWFSQNKCTRYTEIIEEITGELGCSLRDSQRISDTIIENLEKKIFNFKEVYNPLGLN